VPDSHRRPTRLWALPCGGERVPASLLDPSAASDREPIFLPYFFYVIESPAALVLYDCGANSDFAVAESERHHTTGSSQVAVRPEDNLAAVLGRVGRFVSDVDLVVLSHLHYDHCGGLPQLPGADVYAGRAELEFATAPVAGQRDAYCTADFAPIAPEHWRRIDGEQDLLGDGSLLIVPTPGHTPGHVALLVRLPHHTLVLAGDASYDIEAMRRRHLPGFFWDADAVTSSWEVLEELERSEDAEIVLTHEVQPGARTGPTQWYD
jgi:N-acyl homoserine lactone hydrolase